VSPWVGVVRQGYDGRARRKRKMDQRSWLAERFEENRPRLRAVQEAWLVTFTFANATVSQVEVIGDPARLRELDIAVL
jgi:hypothetical protein